MDETGTGATDATAVDCETTSTSDCSLWQLLCFCRSIRWNKSGSEASLLKSGVPSSVCASRRTLTSHDNIAASVPPAGTVEERPHDSAATDHSSAGRQSPSYLKVSRCVGGYSSFTSYSSDRMTSSSHAVPPSQNGNSSKKMTAVSARSVDTVADCAAGIASCVVTVVPKGGQRCQLTVVDNTIADLCSVPPMRGASGTVDAPVTATTTTLPDGDAAVRCPGADRRNGDALYARMCDNGGIGVRSQSQCHSETPYNGLTTDEPCDTYRTSCNMTQRTAGGNGFVDFSADIGSERLKDSQRDSVDVDHAPSICNGIVNVVGLVVLDGPGSGSGHSVPNGDVWNGDVRVDVLSSTSPKDGASYIEAVDLEERRLEQLCREVEGNLLDRASNLPDEVEGKMRSAIGKAKLLTTKKFKQFRELCKKNINEDVDDPFPTTVGDLAGFWDMVLLQVTDVSSMFDELHKLQEAGWKTSDEPPSKSSVSSIGVTQKQPGSKPRNVRRSQPPTTINKAGKADTSSSRDEARQRLMAAKMAGRQRKVSESEKDIEIFVS